MAKPLKLLVRRWLPGKGCVHQRSASLSELEALELLEAARGAIEKVQDSGGIEEIPLAKGRAYVKARRSPDPDEPSRMAPGFVLVSIPDPDAFLREVVAREFDELLRSAADKALDHVPSSEKNDLGKLGWKNVDLGKPTPLSKNKTPRLVQILKKHVMFTRILIIPICLLVIMLIWTGSPGKEGRTPSQLDQKNDGSDPEYSNWTEVREQIENILAADWSRNLISDNKPTIGTKIELLRRFSGLFKRPNLKEKLTDKDFKKYDVLESSEHPFVAFLDRFPEKIPTLQDVEPDLTPSEAMAYLKDLDKKLKASKPFPIDLGTGLPQGTLFDNVKRVFSYPEFFEDWKKALSINDPSRNEWENKGKYDEGREKDSAYRWVFSIRELIKASYSGS